MSFWSFFTKVNFCDFHFIPRRQSVELYIEYLEELGLNPGSAIFLF